MLKFILNRLWYGILVMLGVIVIVFALFQILPGDASKMLVGQRSDISTTDAIIKDLGLDQPKYIQLIGYVNDMSPISFYNSTDENSFFFLDNSKYTKYVSIATIGKTSIVAKAPYLKRSYQTQRPVGEMISQAFPKTLVLAIVAMIIALTIGILLGIISAIYKDSFIDKSALVGSVFGMSLPSFFFAILIAWIFAFLLGDFTGLNMTGSLYTIDDFGNGEKLNLANLILPSIALGIRPLAVITELTRASLLDVLSMDYIRTAKAKGLSKRRIIFKHGLKNSLNPIITSSTGWFATMLAGSVFVEYVFDWKGMGTMIVDALDKYDMPVL
ncbi:ABC transporter permease, partial [Bacteroidales bacterium OttesenSCG-928-K22]|nr:ABC transporter permease [Bacteroidales bacterium OttesenSCG-928-L14]MDL2241224.1 ABC transporter permease [Bacteroidales bacterium OttesenSCG-928-K22]